MTMEKAAHTPIKVVNSLEDMIAAAIISARSPTGTSEAHICSFVKVKGGDPSGVPKVRQEMVSRGELIQGKDGYIYMGSACVRDDVSATPAGCMCKVIWVPLNISV